MEQVKGIIRFDSNFGMLIGKATKISLAERKKSTTTGAQEKCQRKFA